MWHIKIHTEHTDFDFHLAKDITFSETMLIVYERLKGLTAEEQRNFVVAVVKV